MGLQNNFLKPYVEEEQTFKQVAICEYHKLNTSTSKGITVLNKNLEDSHWQLRYHYELGKEPRKALALSEQHTERLQSAGNNQHRECGNRYSLLAEENAAMQRAQTEVESHLKSECGQVLILAKEDATHVDRIQRMLPRRQLPATSFRPHLQALTHRFRTPMQPLQFC